MENVLYNRKAHICAFANARSNQQMNQGQSIDRSIYLSICLSACRSLSLSLSVRALIYVNKFDPCSGLSLLIVVPVVLVVQGNVTAWRSENGLFPRA